MKFMVCYDDSNVAADALKLAVQRAKTFNAKVYVVTSIKGGPEVPRKVFVHAEEELNQVQDQVEDQGIECETRVSVRGLEPGEDLVQFAKDQKIEEIFWYMYIGSPEAIRPRGHRCRSLLIFCGNIRK